MAGPLPLGDPAPENGLLPESAAGEAASRDFGVYVHVPFCAVRCGYCDFNTYTAAELRGTSQDDYPGHAATEIAFAADALRNSGVVSRPVSTVFFGGGTPTLLSCDNLAFLLDSIGRAWEVEPGAEITVEANPDSIDAVGLRQLAQSGFTRVSFGMQSATPHVLATLERTHDPDRIPRVVEAAHEAGLSVSLDLIYGTPGETLLEWERTLSVALSLQPDHLSAYALIVEPGTRLARQIRRGDYPEPDDDLQADMYESAEKACAQEGFAWYEISNWARRPQERSRHNLSYWRGHDWWGIGPGAHSHIGGVRWWNVKHPATYANRVTGGHSPAAGREILTDEQKATERVLLLTRLSEGLPLDELDHRERQPVIAQLLADGSIEPRAVYEGRVVLTLSGRLLADQVVRHLTNVMVNG